MIITRRYILRTRAAGRTNDRVSGRVCDLRKKRRKERGKEKKKRKKRKKEKRKRMFREYALFFDESIRTMTKPEGTRFLLLLDSRVLLPNAAGRPLGAAGTTASGRRRKGDLWVGPSGERKIVG